MPETAQLTVRLDLTGNLTSGITKAQRQLAGLNKSAGKVGRGFGQMSAGLSRAGLFVGGAAVAGLGAAAKAAIDFEDAFAGVRKTVDEADLTKVGLSFDSLSRSFRNMATEIPIAATEFARLGETAGALGIKAQDIEKFAKTTALMGVTTNLTADEAADAFGRIGTILGLTGNDFEELADSIVALGNAGASTEAEITEITKRFAAEAKSAGLAKEEIVGLASVTASLGFAPERGGTALARVFGNMSTNISLANEKGRELSKGLGRSIKDLRGSVNRGEGLGIFLDVLETIRDMKPTEAARFLAKIGVKNVSDRNLFRTMADQLPEVTRQLGIAADATGALSEEATKRFDTVRAKLQLLKNGLIEAGITIGEGFAPAIGRAAEKLSTFLKQDANKSALKELGEDIGEAIDGIDWEEVLAGARDFVGVMKTALGWTLRILDAIKAMPGEIKGALLGFVALNKLSGGLLAAGAGNVVGGLAGAAATGIAGKAPVVGKLFAQPVFVTNWPVGGLGGGLGAGAAGGGLLATVGAVALPVTIAAVGTQAATDMANASLTSKGIKGKFETPGGGILPFGLEASFKNISTALSILTGSKPKDAEGDRRAILQNEQTTRRGLEQVKTAQAGVTTAVETMRGNMVSALTGNKTAIDNAARATAIGAALGAATARFTSASNAATISAAIRANRPITYVNVDVTANSYTQKVNVTDRYGNPNGSRNQGNTSEGGMGGH